MTSTFLASYVVLCTVLLVESHLIHSMLVLVVQRRDARERAIRATWYGRLTGTDVPDFRAAYANRKGSLTRADLVGQRSVLLFVSPKSIAEPAAYRWLLATTRAKLDATRYFAICSGPKAECEALRQFEGDNTGVGQDVFQAANDDDGGLVRQFGIASLPALIAVDEMGCVMKAGHAAFRRSADAPARALS